MTDLTLLRTSFGLPVVDSLIDWLSSPCSIVVLRTDLFGGPTTSPPGGAIAVVSA